jgi:hypothetical protein
MIPDLIIGSGDKRCSHMSARIQSDAGFDFLVKNDGKLVDSLSGLWLMQSVYLPVAGFHMTMAMLAYRFGVPQTGPRGPAVGTKRRRRCRLPGPAVAALLVYRSQGVRRGAYLAWGGSSRRLVQFIRQPDAASHRFL